MMVGKSLCNLWGFDDPSVQGRVASVRTSSQATLSSASDYQDRIEDEERKEEKQHEGLSQKEMRERKKTFFSSFGLQSQVTENGNGKCRSKCNFPLPAVVRLGGWEGSLPWGAARSAITHQQLCTKAALIKGQTEPVGEG